MVTNLTCLVYLVKYARFSVFRDGYSTSNAHKTANTSVAKYRSEQTWHKLYILFSQTQTHTNCSDNQVRQVHDSRGPFTLENRDSFRKIITKNIAFAPDACLTFLYCSKMFSSRFFVRLWHDQGVLWILISRLLSL